jgi:hypothetical protein
VEHGSVSIKEPKNMHSKLAQNKFSKSTNTFKIVEMEKKNIKNGDTKDPILTNNIP